MVTLPYIRCLHSLAEPGVIRVYSYEGTNALACRAALLLMPKVVKQLFSLTDIDRTNYINIFRRLSLRVQISVKNSEQLRENSPIDSNTDVLYH